MSPFIVSATALEAARRGLLLSTVARSQVARARRLPSDDWSATAYAVLGVGVALILLGTVSGAWMH